MKTKVLSRVLSGLLASAFCLTGLQLEPLVKAAQAAGDDGDTASVVAVNGDINGDGIISEEDANSVLNVKLENCPQADVNADGVLDQEDADMIASFVSGEINYFPVGTYYVSGQKFITRGEWIHALSEGFHMSVDEEDTIVEYFTDIDECEYKKDIDLAANFGVFDVLEEEFHPDEYVTRDFAAHTMNFCIGYADTENILFTDTEEVYYDVDAQAALDHGWFKAQNGEFRPSMYVTSAEADLAYADMNTAYESMIIDEDYDSTIEYDSSVIDLTKCETVDFSGNVLVIDTGDTSVESDSNISFMLDDQTVVRHVTEVSTDEATGKTKLIVEDADEELVTDADAEGYAYIDFDNFQSLQEGIDVEVIETEEQLPLPFESARKMVNKSGKIDLKNVKVKLKGSRNIGGGKLTINGELSNIKVPYTLKTKGLTLKEFYLGFEADGNVTATYSKQLSSPEAASIPLATVPVAGIGVMGVNLVVSANFSIGGEITIGYSFDVSGGLRYKKGDGWSVPRDFHSKSFSVEAKVKLKTGVKVCVEARIGKKAIGELYLAAGISATLKTSATSESSLICTDLKAYFYAEIGANFKLFSLKYSDSWEFINENNTPVSVHMHIENGKEVPACTRGQKYNNSSDATHKGGSLSGKKSGGYVKGTGYTSGYKKATKGSTFTKVYYKSTIVFKEMEPPHIITSDMELTEDTTIHSDLVICNEATLSLNGHKLTVEGNVRIGADLEGYSYGGYLNVGGGSAYINGDMVIGENSTWCGLTMENKNDYVLVKGDFKYTASIADNKLTAGTLELQGNIKATQKIGSEDMHKIILSGTKDVTIDISEDSNESFNMVEIKNSDKRKFIIDKYFVGASSVTCDGSSLNIICNDGGNNASVLGFGKLTVDNLNVNGDLALRDMNFVGTMATFDGNVTLNYDSEITLKKATVTIKGDLTNTTGENTFTLGGSTLRVEGNFDYNDYSGDFVMNNKNDKLYVGGDFKMTNNDDSISDGLIDIKGDVYLDGMETTGYNKVVLSGDKELTVYMGGENWWTDNRHSRLAYMEIQNTDKRKVIIDGYFISEKTNCGTNPLNIETRDGCFAPGELTCSELNVSGDFTIDGDMKLKTKKATFDGDVTIADTAKWDAVFDLNGASVAVAKTLTVKSDTDIHGGTLTCGEFVLEGEMLTMNGGKLNVAGDMTVNGGSITMASKNDLIDIKGDLNIPRDSQEDNITAGTIQCAGDIRNAGKAPLNVKDGASFVLTGEKDQILDMIGWFSYSDDHQFGNMKILNAADRKIINRGNIDAATLAADADTINWVSENGWIDNVKLLVDVNIEGDTSKGGKTIDLNGHTMNINGNLYQEYGTITPNTGKLLISGDYMIVKEHDSAVVGASEGTLNMVNDGDYVLVGGNFVTKSEKDHTKNLTAGTLEVKGDFSQLSGGSEKAFPASGKHIAILSGTEKQRVTFEDYDKSHFNILVLKQNRDQYEFSDDPCWVKLGTDETTTTTTTTTSSSTTSSSATTTTTTSATTSSSTKDSSTTKSSTTTSSSTTGSSTTTDSSTSSSSTSSNSTTNSITTSPDTTTTSGTSTTVPSKGYTPGNPNGDGKVDASDATFVLVIYADLATGGADTLSAEIKAAADVNKDGKIDSKDASAILSYYSYRSTGGKDDILVFLDIKVNEPA